MRPSALVDGVVEFVDELVRGLRSWAGLSAESYIDLETSSSGEDHIIQAGDGSCVSLLQWMGSSSMVGEAEFEANVEALAQNLRASFAKPGHVIEMMFGCDRTAEHGAAAMDGFINPLKSTAKRLGLDLNDVLDDRKRALAKHCAPEYCYLAVWTTPLVIHSTEYAEDRERHKKETKDLPRGKRAQLLSCSTQSIIDAHRSFVEFLQTDIRKRQVVANLLTSRKALKVIRGLIDESFTGEGFTPMLPGDKVWPGSPTYQGTDISHLLPIPLSEQLIPREPRIIDLKCVQIGDRIWSPLVVTVPPREPQPFHTLFSRMRSTGLSWRIKFTISSGGLKDNSLNRSFASAMTFASPTNVGIDKAYKEGLEDELEGSPRVGLRIMAATWTPCSPNVTLEERRKLSEGSSRLMRAIQGWGACDVTEATGNPSLGFFCTLPGVRLSSIAPPSNPPLHAALRFLPWSRAASPWERGHFLFRTMDGKPYPYSSFSSVQDASVKIFISGMGGGKSTMLNSLNLGLTLDPGNEALPFIRILDIGPSSSALPSLISSGLPHDQRDRAQYHRIRNTSRYAMNPLDTPLGQRFPLPEHRSFLVSYISLLATPIDQSAPYDGISAIAGLCIDMAYKKFADLPSSEPRRYSSGSSLQVDQGIARHRFEVDKNTTYRELCDRFMALGDTTAAHAAHRMAMPMISDIATLAMEDSIMKDYRDNTPSGVPIPEWFRRKLLEVVREFPVLAEPTRFALGEASILSLDLDEVCKAGSPTAQRTTTIMYLLALWILSNDFFIGEELLPLIHPDYRAYHAARIKRLKASKKCLVADEFHRPAEGSPLAVMVVDQIVREGRKWQIDVSLSSQLVKDIPASIIKNTTCVFVLKPPMDGTDELKAKFNLTDTETYAINTFLHGPGPDGANVFCKFLTKQGPNSQILTNTCGPIEMWGFSTTPEDTSIRNQLYKIAPPAEVRQVLAAQYPRFAKSEVERRSALRALTDGDVMAAGTVEDEILGELKSIIARRRDASIVPPVTP